MPPKPKFSREDFLKSALEIVNSDGIDALSARSVAGRLNTTVTPLFTLFSSMEELKNELYKFVKKDLLDYLRGAYCYDLVFKEFGFRWISYAKNKPNLYNLLFHKDFLVQAKDLLEEIKKIRIDIVSIICETFGVSYSEAEEIYNCLSLQAEGITMRVLNGSKYSDEEILNILGVTCLGIVNLIKIKNGTFDLELANKMSNNAGIVPKKIK